MAPQDNKFDGQDKVEQQPPQSSNTSQSLTAFDVANLPPDGRGNSSTMASRPYTPNHAQLTWKPKVNDHVPKRMVQKRTIPIGGAKPKKNRSNDLTKLPLKLSEPDNLVIASPLQTIKPTSEVLATHEAKRIWLLGTELTPDSSVVPAACNVEKRPEFVEDPTTIPIDMNSAPSDENEPNSSIVEAVRMASL
ncbi:hypothetical protein COLO4_22625 [Corchorus olitorius]|uniref:Uncharacterized protein n=1 Tax=Corchorus olitorius TaxID=93759 RepID=A0A1R3IKX7_9ROSI|nr:hypothetical protein COLO4_22625 [Corchorus olitorius]